MNRRKFVKKTSIASIGALSALNATEFFALNKDVDAKAINIGVIGTGGRGQGLIPVINAIEGLEITAICDILPFRLEAAQKVTGPSAKAYSNYLDLLNDPKVDAVLISTPFSTHAKIAIDAIEKKKHIYCEKTLAKGIKEIDGLVAKVAEADLIFQTGHQYHSSRLYKYVVDLIHKDAIGKVRSFECRWYRQGDWRKPVPEPKYERAINWRMYREYSGGMTAELSSHQIDFVNWVLGENPAKIMGTGGINFWEDGRETYDNTHLIFEYPSGVKAQFKCLTSLIPGGYQVKVIGDKGIITIGTTKAWIKYYKQKKEKKYENVDGVSGATAAGEYIPELGKALKVEHLEPSKQALVDFKNSIIHNKQPISNIYTGADTAKAVHLAIEAMISGEVKHW